MRRFVWFAVLLVCFGLTNAALIGCGQGGSNADLTEEQAEEQSMQMSGMYSDEGEELGDESEPDLGTPGYEEESAEGQY